MEVLKIWVMRLFATALISAGVLSITPEGSTKKVLRAVCGFAALAALLSPVSRIDADEFDIFTDDVRARGAEIAGNAADDADQMTKTIIEEKCAAYISDKAVSMGISAEIEVKADKEENGLFRPSFVTVKTSDGGKQSELEKIIAEEIGIPADKQKWCINE